MWPKFTFVESANIQSLHLSLCHFYSVAFGILTVSVLVVLIVSNITFEFRFFCFDWGYRNIERNSDFDLVDVLKRFKVVSIMAQWLHFVASLAQWLIPSSKKSHQGSLQNILFLIYSLNLFEGHFYQLKTIMISSSLNMQGHFRLIDLFLNWSLWNHGLTVASLFGRYLPEGCLAGS